MVSKGAQELPTLLGQQQQGGHSLRVVERVLSAVWPTSLWLCSQFASEAWPDLLRYQVYLELQYLNTLKNSLLRGAHLNRVLKKQVGAAI